MGGCVRQEQSLLGGPLSAGSTDGLDDLWSLFQPKQFHYYIFFSGIPAIFGKEMLRHSLSSFSMSLEKYGIPGMVTTRGHHYTQFSKRPSLPARYFLG